jgi:hypothetical protein
MFPKRREGVRSQWPHFRKPLSGWPDTHTVWHRQRWHSPLCAMQNACTHAATEVSAQAWSAFDAEAFLCSMIEDIVA